MAFVSIIALVPAVMIASPAQAQGELTIVNASADEGGTITFNLAYTGVNPASYQVSTSSISATADEDYTPLVNAPAVDFIGGLETKQVSIQTANDDIDEINETFSLQAISASPIDSASATGTILDTDPTPTYVLSTASSVPETVVPGPNATTVSRKTQVTATLSAPSSLPILIPVVSADLSAVSVGDHPDFVAVEENIVIAVGESTGFVDITILDDLRDEDAVQSFTVAEDGTPTNTVAFNDAAKTVTVNILDDDNAPTVSVGGAGQVEEGLPLEFQMTLSAASEKVVTVNVKTADGTDVVGSTAATAATDYTAVDQTLSFPAETTGLPAVVQTTEDGVVEASPEGLTITLSNPMFATLGTPATAVGAIADDEAAPMVTLSPLETLEGGKTVDVIATLSGESALPVSIDYIIGAGTATDGTDFVSAADSIVIPPGETTGTIPVQILADTMDEGEETVVITLSSPDMTINASSVGPQNFTIADDDAKPKYTVISRSIDEGDAGNMAMISVTLTNPSANDIDFAVTSGADAPGGGSDSAVIGGVEPGSNDYVMSNATLNIPAGTVTGSLVVSVIGDFVFEFDEFATLGVLPATGETDVDSTVPLDGQHAAQLTLLNDDFVPVLTFTEATGSEGTYLRLSGTVTGIAQDPIPLDLAYGSLGLNAAGPEDYDASASPTSAVIEPGDTVVALNDVFLNQDTIDEVTETFNVVATESVLTVLGATAKSAKAKSAKSAKAKSAKSAKAKSAKAKSAKSAKAKSVQGLASGTEVTANVNGGGDFGFARAEGTYGITDDPGDLPPTAYVGDASIGENLGSVDVTVDLQFDGTTTATQQAFVLPWWTENGTAIAGSDYVGVQSGSLVIPAGELTKTLNVAITNDDLYEQDENFLVQLGTPTPAGATVGKSVGEVTIESEDDPTAPTMIAPASIRGVGLVTVYGVTSPGAMVDLMLGKFGTTTPLVKISEVMANNAGEYSFTQRIGSATRFGVRSNGLDSVERTVRIVQVPGFTVASRSTGALTFTVQGNPKIANQIVHLQRQRSDGSWYIVARGNTGSTRVWVKTQTGFRSGSGYTFRAYIVGDASQGTLTGYSPARFIRVR